MEGWRENGGREEEAKKKGRKGKISYLNEGKAL